MSEQNPIIYTQAQIKRSPIKHSDGIPSTVHICAEDDVSEILIILTKDEFTDEIKQWLRTLPMEHRQMVLDELVACTLRTVE